MPKDKTPFTPQQILNLHNRLLINLYSGSKQHADEFAELQQIDAELNPEDTGETKPQQTEARD